MPAALLLHFQAILKGAVAGDFIKDQACQVSRISWDLQAFSCHTHTFPRACSKIGLLSCIFSFMALWCFLLSFLFHSADFDEKA